MNYYIIIPAYNEEKNIELTLNSVLKQTLLPKKIIVVNDNSTDKTLEIATNFSNKYDFIEVITTNSQQIHLPGSKVINAFTIGLETLDENYDFVVKLDADLILPENYFERIRTIFTENPKVGITGGRAFIEKNGNWVLENLTDDDHIRGAFKSYRKQCFIEIGKLKSEMGWDTLDEFLARYYGWEIIVDKSLKIKHLKPTGQAYNLYSRHKQGEAFYKLGYGFFLTFLASLKLALKKRKPFLFFDYMNGFFKAKFTKKKRLVTSKQAQFIRMYRWKKIRKKIFDF